MIAEACDCTKGMRNARAMHVHKRQLRGGAAGGHHWYSLAAARGVWAAAKRVGAATHLELHHEVHCWLVGGGLLQHQKQGSTELLPPVGPKVLFCQVEAGSHLNTTAGVAADGSLSGAQTVRRCLKLLQPCGRAHAID